MQRSINSFKSWVRLTAIRVLQCRWQTCPIVLLQVRIVVIVVFLKRTLSHVSFSWQRCLWLLEIVHLSYEVAIGLQGSLTTAVLRFQLGYLGRLMTNRLKRLPLLGALSVAIRRDCHPCWRNLLLKLFNFQVGQLDLCFLFFQSLLHQLNFLRCFWCLLDELFILLAVFTVMLLLLVHYFIKVFYKSSLLLLQFLIRLFLVPILLPFLDLTEHNRHFLLLGV